MKIYTKTGDHGETGLFAGPRVAKDHVRIEAYGTVDELNAALGVAHAVFEPDSEIQQVIARLQDELFAVGAELATPDPARHGTDYIQEPHVEQLEAIIDRYEEQLPALKTFVLPGGTSGSAALHLARAVCRRAERRVLSLAHDPAEQVSSRILKYLNRLGDLLFVLARYANHAAGHTDVPWRKNYSSGS